MMWRSQKINVEYRLGEVYLSQHKSLLDLASLVNVFQEVKEWHRLPVRLRTSPPASKRQEKRGSPQIARCSSSWESA